MMTALKVGLDINIHVYDKVCDPYTHVGKVLKLMNKVDIHIHIHDKF